MTTEDENKLAGLSKPVPEEVTALDIGALLKSARVKKKEPIAHISKNLRIHEAYLEALENGEFHKVPGRAYVIGFLQTYARYLNLNSHKIVEDYKKLHSQPDNLGNLTPLTFNAAEGSPKSLVVFLAVVILAILCAIGYYYLKPSFKESPLTLKTLDIEVDGESIGNQPENIPCSWEEEKVVNLPGQKKEGFSIEEEQGRIQPLPTLNPHALLVDKEAQEPSLSGGEMTPFSSQVEQGITLYAQEPCWVHVFDDEKHTYIEKTFQEGESFKVPSSSRNLSMITGNAGGLLVNVNGKQLEALGKKGAILKIELNVEKLLRTYSLAN